MTGILAALALFGALSAAIATMRAESADRRPSVAELEAAARRTPRPGARDLHAVTGTLGRAPVPHWG